MKLTSNLILLGSAVVLAASPAAYARGKGHAPKAIHKHAAEGVSDVVAGDDVVVAGGPQKDGGSDGVVVVIDGQGSGTSDNTNDGGATAGGGATDGGTVVVTEPGSEGGAGEPVPDKNPDGGGTPVPIDWIKRGTGSDGNPEVIFYNMAGGPVTLGATGAAAGVTKGNVQLGQADKGAAIEAKGGVTTPQINREKKGPVALVKPGHVFLR